jgi:DNA modification methylase
VFSKDSFTRGVKEKMKSTMTREEFIEYTKSIWSFNAESASKIGHPAPFPVELPLRCIKLFTFEEEVVLDPFIGSGTTAIAALSSNRHYVGYDNDPEYIRLAERRIREFLDRSKQQTFDINTT